MSSVFWGLLGVGADQLPPGIRGIALAVALFLVVATACVALVRKFKWRILERVGARMIPVMIGLCVLAGLFFLSAAGVATYAYMNGLFETAPSAPIPVIAKPADVTPPLKVEATNIPDAPDGIPKQVARVWQLNAALKALAPLREQLKRDGDILVTARLPGARFMGAFASIRYGAAKDQLIEVNNRLYQNRSVDLQTVPELSVPTITAPNEDRFSDGLEKYEYRKAFYAAENVLKQADILVETIKAEERMLRSKVTSEQLAD